MITRLPHKFFRTLAIFAIFFFLAVGLATTMDFHQDCKYHDKCPFCRYQMDGNATHIQIISLIINPQTIQKWLVYQPVNYIVKTVDLGNNLPNAPPICSCFLASS